MLYTSMLNTSTRTNQVVDFVADAFESERQKQWKTAGTFPTITVIFLLFRWERNHSEHLEGIFLDIIKQFSTAVSSLTP